MATTAAREKYLLERINSAAKMPGFKTVDIKATKTKPSKRKFIGQEFKTYQAYGGKQLVLNAKNSTGVSTYSPMLKGQAYLDYLDAFHKGLTFKKTK